MRQLPATTVFDRAELRALGWSDSAIGRAGQSGKLVALRRGQFTRPGIASLNAPIKWDERDRRDITNALAASRTCSGSAISHVTALLMHDLPVLDRRSDRPDLTVPPGRVSGLSAANLHRAALPPGDVVIKHGAMVTSVARTIVDCARSTSTLAAVTAADAALHRHLTTWSELDDVLLRCWNWPGIRRAAHAIDLADARSESALESISRVVLHRLRLPIPTLQAELGDAAGRFIGRVDFYWDEYGVVGEADGAGKYGLSPTSLIEEKQRQEQLEDLGVIFVRWGWDAPTKQPQELRRRLNRAFDRGAARSGRDRDWSFTSPAADRRAPS
jgi:hypothetical protein